MRSCSRSRSCSPTRTARRLSDIVYSASVRRTHHEHRLAVVGRTPEEMAEALGVLVRDNVTGGVVPGRAASAGRPKVVFVFPGQGSQWLGMGRQLLADGAGLPLGDEACDEVIRAQGGFSVLEQLVVFEQEYAATFERNPNLFGGWMAVRSIDGSRLHRNSGERYPPRRGVLRE